jgi:uncharacterized protein (TIGR00369 family)
MRMATDSGGIDPLQRLGHELTRPAFNLWAGARRLKADERVREIEIALPFRPEFSHSATTPLFHGGVISALVDMAAYAAIAVWQQAATPTISLHVEYFSPAPPPELRAKEILRRLGQSVSFADVEVMAGDKIVALGRGIFSVRGARQ